MRSRAGIVAARVRTDACEYGRSSLPSSVGERGFGAWGPCDPTVCAHDTLMSAARTRINCCRPVL